MSTTYDIDHELEDFSDEEVTIMIEMFENAVEQYTEKLDTMMKTPLDEIIKEVGDHPFAQIAKMILDLDPKGSEGAAQRAKDKSYTNVKARISMFASITMKLHLLKSRI